MGHSRRRQSQREGRGLVSQTRRDAWKQGLPLLRLQGERIYQNQGVFDVDLPTCSPAAFWIWNRTPPTRPDSSCPIRTVSPAKAARPSTKTVTVRTRPEPKPYAGGRVFHVYPPGYKGTKIEPAFDGADVRLQLLLRRRRYRHRRPAARQAGDTILVHAGLYKYHPEYYTGDRTINATTPFEGTYYLTASGTPEKPIVIKGRRRRRSDLRRQRQLQPVQRQGRELQLFRRRDDPEYGHRRSGRARNSSPAQRA